MSCRIVLRTSRNFSDLMSIQNTGSKVFLPNVSQRSSFLLISMYSPIRARAIKTYSSSPSTSPAGADSTVSYRLVLSFQLRCSQLDHISLNWRVLPLVNGLILQPRSASSRCSRWNVLLGFGDCGLDFICGLRVLGSSLINPTINLLRSSTATDCGKGRDVGLPGGVAGGCGETDGLGAIPVGAMVLVKEQIPKDKDL